MWNNGLEMDYSYDDYMEQIRDMARRNVHTNPCFISMENPIIWDNNYNDYSYKLIYTLTSIAQGKWDYNSDFWDSRVEEEILDRYTTTNEDGDTDYSELENTTFDGVIIKNIHDSISNEGSSNVFTTEYLVWNPNQIKSVYNKGIWNLYNDDVMENTTLTEGVEEIKKYFPKIPVDDVNKLLKLDPTYKGGEELGTYSKWILTLYNNFLKDEIRNKKWEEQIAQGNNYPEPERQSQERIEDFDKIPNLLNKLIAINKNNIANGQHKIDISQFKSVNDLYSFIANTLNAGVSENEKVNHSLKLVRESVKKAEKLSIKIMIGLS